MKKRPAALACFVLASLLLSSTGGLAIGIYVNTRYAGSCGAGTLGVPILATSGVALGSVLGGVFFLLGKPARHLCPFIAVTFSLLCVFFSTSKGTDSVHALSLFFAGTTATGAFLASFLFLIAMKFLLRFERNAVFIYVLLTSIGMPVACMMGLMASVFFAG